MTTITRIEQLDALPEGTVVKSADEEVWRRDDDDSLPWHRVGYGPWSATSDIKLPAVTLTPDEDDEGGHWEEYTTGCRQVPGRVVSARDDAREVDLVALQSVAEIHRQLWLAFEFSKHGRMQDTREAIAHAGIILETLDAALQ